MYININENYKTNKMFSNLLDITGFFVSVLINLLLIALICYYFKRKIDNLELSQSEQAKTLYALLSENSTSNKEDNAESKNVIMNVDEVIRGLDSTQFTQSDNKDHEHDERNLNSSDGSDSDSEDDENEDDENEDDESEPAQVVLEEDVSVEDTPQEFVSDENMVSSVVDSNVIKIETSNLVSQDDGNDAVREQVEDVITDNVETTVEDYDKMTIKELKTVLAEKGIHAKSSMNKGDIINILKGTSSMTNEDDK